MTFLAVAAATGSNLLDGAALGVVLVGAMWLILGYALHCTRLRRCRFAHHARVRRVERHVPGRAAAAVRLRAVVRHHLRRLAQHGVRGARLSPPSAPVASTTLYATGDAGLGEVFISAAICAAATVATARVAATIYERSILRTGARVRIREALRGESSA